MIQRYTHFTLVEHMQALGYLSDPEGVCFGYAHMAIQAVLSGEMDKFNARMNYLNEHIEEISALAEQYLNKNEGEPLKKPDGSRHLTKEVRTFF